jgi:hypothetical protein
VDEHALFISLGDAENIDVDVLGVLVLEVPTLLDAAAELLLLVLLVVRWMTGGDVGSVGVMRNGNLNVPLAKLDNILWGILYLYLFSFRMIPCWRCSMLHLFFLDWMWSLTREGLLQYPHLRQYPPLVVIVLLDGK